MDAATLPRRPQASVEFTADAPPALVVAGSGPSLLAGNNKMFGSLVPNFVAPTPPASLAESHQRAGPIRVGGDVQMAKLLRKVIPVYPPLARSARIAGVVHLLGTIAKDGSIQNLQLVSGHPLLARAAIEAVQQWVYKPTSLNGNPVEVIAPIEVDFTLAP